MDKRTELPEVTICIHKHGTYDRSMFKIPNGIHVNILNAAPVNSINLVGPNSTEDMFTVYQEYLESPQPLSLEEMCQINGFAYKKMRIKHGLTRKESWLDTYSEEEIKNYYRSSGWELLMDPRIIPDIELTSEPGWDDITILGTTKGPLHEREKIYPGSRSNVYLSEVIKDLIDRGYKKIFIINLSCRVMDIKNGRDARNFFRGTMKLHPSERAEKWFHKGGTRKYKKGKKSIVKYRRSKHL